VRMDYIQSMARFNNGQTTNFEAHLLGENESVEESCIQEATLLERADIGFSAEQPFAAIRCVIHMSDILVRCKCFINRDVKFCSFAFRAQTQLPVKRTDYRAVPSSRGDDSGGGNGGGGREGAARMFALVVSLAHVHNISSVPAGGDGVGASDGGGQEAPSPPSQLHVGFASGGTKAIVTAKRA